MKRTILTVLVLSCVLLASLSCFSADEKRLTVFFAAGFTPVIDQIKESAEKKLDVKLMAEGSGTQVACRKISDLGRKCDILISADEKLFAQLLPEQTDFRIDFAVDEIVLAVGQRAKYVDEVEKDPAATIFHEKVSLGRGDESSSPIGYRTLMVWQLMESESKIPGLLDNFKSKTVKVVDDVIHLTPLLKSGEIDYAFIYKSMCIAQGIRYIKLSPKVNLGSMKENYSSVNFKLKNGKIISGGPVLFSLTIPGNAENRTKAVQFIAFLLNDCGNVLEENGFIPIKPHFYGNKDLFEQFAKFAEFIDEK